MRVFGWSPTDMRQREDAFAALVDDKITNLGRHAVQIFKSERSIVAAGTPVAPVDLGSLGAITSMWKGYVQAELMPALSDVYLMSASVIWQGIDEAFDELVVPPVGDTFAEEYLKNASNRLVGIGDRVWLKVREELLTGFSLGESVTKLADRVQTAANVSQARANVIARTEANMAANAGSFQQVLVSGLTGTKEWLDTSDERTRCSHRAAGGQTVNILETFKLGGPECGTGVSHLTIPGDPTAPPSEIIQCRCSVAFDLEMADESVVTAAAEVQTGAMIALLPIVEDAALMQLSGSYAEPADQLHVTLLYLGDAADWSVNEQQLLQDVVKEIVEKYTMIETSTFSVNVFNPGSSEFDTAVVLGVRGSDLLVALHDAISSNISDVFSDEVPEQHVPWVPHITLAYTDDVTEVMPEAIDKLNTVTFDRVGVFFGGQVTEYPLGVRDPDDPVIAAAQWKEAEHPRGPDGKFAKGASFIKKLASYSTPDVLPTTDPNYWGSRKAAHEAAKANRAHLKLSSPEGAEVASLVERWTGNATAQGAIRKEIANGEHQLAVDVIEHGPAAPTLYRSISLKAKKALHGGIHSGTTTSDFSGDPEKYLASLVPGKEIDLRGFSSFTEDEAHAANFGDVTFRLTDARGLPIADISSTPHEKEWFVGGSMRVTKVRKKGKKTFVDVEWIPPTKKDETPAKSSSNSEDILSFLKGETDDLPFDFTDKNVTSDLDAVPPSSTTLSKKGKKVKYSAPEGLPGLLNLADDPGKSGDGYATKTDGSKGPWGRYGAAGVILRHRGDDGVDRYLLVARGEQLSQAGKWQLPGGGLDSKETPAQGAAREIVEELGFDPNDVLKARVHGYHEMEVPNTGGWKYTSIAATVPDKLIPDLSGENAKLETGDAQWLTVDEIQALDDQGKLLGPLANGQWKENMVDLFPEDVKTPEVPGSQPGGMDDVLAGDFTKLKKITGPKGSNEGGIFEAPDGTRWYVKKQKSAAHARNERDASALYREAGIDVPRVVIGAGTPELGSGTHTATQIIPEGDKKLGAVAAGMAGDNGSGLAAVREGFAMDALLANWDVAGLTYDNVIFDKNGKPYRIDVGGALEFRAQGAPKGSAFDTSVGEWDSLRSSSNPQSAKLFKGMSDAELAASIDHVEKLTPEKIREIVEDKKLADKLIARREDLLKRAEQEGVLTSMSGEVDFHPIDEHKLDLGIAGKTDAELAAMVQTGHVVDDGSIGTITNGGPPIDKSTVWWDVQAGNHGVVGDVIATGTKDGSNYRLIVAQKSDNETYIVEQLELKPNTWVTYAGFPTEKSFKNAPLSKYGISNSSKNLIDDEIDTDVPSPTDAFNQHMANKDKVLAQPTVGKLSGKTFDYSDEPQNAIWQQAFLHGQHDNGDIILKGESLDGKQNPLQVVVRKDPVTGDPYLEELEYDFADGSWNVGRTWHNEAEFNDASLEEYDVVKSKKSTFESSVGVVPSTTIATHPGPFSSTGASHAKLWNQVGNGTYPGGYGAAGGISPHDDKYHRLTATKFNGSWVLMDEVEGTEGEGDFYPLKTYYSLHDFGQADFSYMGIGKSSTPPGLIKSATTPSSVPAVLPKKVPKLTNAIIYGKHQNGDVIATSGDGFIRVVYQDNKIHIQLNNGDGNWVGKGHSKAEAYKKLQVNESGWFLGDVSPPSVTPPSLTTPSVSTPAVKTKSTLHDFKTTILHGNYEDGQVIATFKSKISSGESRWVWSAPNATFVKQSRASKTGPWKVITKTQDPGKVIENVIMLPSEGGVWSPGQKPKFGVGVPSDVTPLPPPTQGLNLVETIKQGKYNDGDVVGTYSKPGVGPQVRMIFSGGVFVKQTRPDNDSKWVTAKTYHTDDEAIESMNKGSGTWTKVGEPSGGLKPPPKVALMTTDVKVSFKKTFDDNAVKWHTSADKMLIALSETLKKHPEFTSAQVLSFMDSTTKTKTSPTPFTDKVTKYLKTSNGLQQAKLLGIPGVHVKSKSKPSSSSSSYFSPPSTPTKVTPTVTIIHEPPPSTTSMPGIYKIQTVPEMDALHNIMMAQHGKWTSTQESTFKSYTGSSYVSMNGCLRNPEKCTPHSLTMIKNAQDGMRPIPKPVHVTRGAGWGAVGLETDDIGNKSPAERIALLQMLEGKAVQEPGFFSTSSAKSPAFSGKPILFEIDVPAGTPVAWVKKVSGYKSENELLLASGLKYRIKKVTPPSGYGYGPVRVHLEVILP